MFFITISAKILHLQPDFKLAPIKNACFGIKKKKKKAPKQSSIYQEIS